MNDLQAIANTARDRVSVHETSDLRFDPNNTHHRAQHPESASVSDDEDGEEEDEHGEKKYKCDHCSHAFTRKHNLKSHLLIHTQEKPFNCSICSSKFRRLHDLKRHEKLHTGEKPHQCKQCGRKFARADALVRHANSQAGCALLLDDVLHKDGSSEVDSVESPGVMGKSVPQKRSYETAHWRLETDGTKEKQHHRRESRHDHAAITESSNGEREARSTAGALIGSEEVNENVKLLPYVRLLEARVASLENKLTFAEAKITQLGYAITGRRPEGML